MSLWISIFSGLCILLLASYLVSLFCLPALLSASLRSQTPVPHSLLASVGQSQLTTQNPFSTHSSAFAANACILLKLRGRGPRSPDQMSGLLPPFSQFLQCILRVWPRGFAWSTIHHWTGQQFRGGSLQQPPFHPGPVSPISITLDSRKVGKHSEIKIDLIEKLRSQSIFLDGTFLLDAVDHYKRNRSHHIALMPHKTPDRGLEFHVFIPFHFILHSEERTVISCPVVLCGHIFLRSRLGFLITICTVLYNLQSTFTCVIPFELESMLFPFYRGEHRKQVTVTQTKGQSRDVNLGVLFPRVMEFSLHITLLACEIILYGAGSLV